MMCTAGALMLSFVTGAHYNLLICGNTADMFVLLPMFVLQKTKLEDLFCKRRIPITACYFTFLKITLSSYGQRLPMWHLQNFTESKNNVQ